MCRTSKNKRTIQMPNKSDKKEDGKSPSWISRKIFHKTKPQAKQQPRGGATSSGRKRKDKGKQRAAKIKAPEATSMQEKKKVPSAKEDSKQQSQNSQLPAVQPTPQTTESQTTESDTSTPMGTVQVINAKQIRHPSGNLRDVVLRLTGVEYVGHGVFGNVYKSLVIDPPIENNVVAVKKIWPRDVEEKERQIILYRQLHHENLCRLMFVYSSDAPKKQTKTKKQPSPSQHIHSHTSKKDRIERACWCLVTEFVETSCRAYHDSLRDRDQYLDNLTIQKWTFQMWIGLEYLAAQKIIHRDLKPDNMLLDPKTHMIKIADFGSAKMVHDQKTKSIAYMITRYYRPPEMILGYQYYQYKVDVWSAACILGEFHLGDVLLDGDDVNDQFERIQKQLGSPTADEVHKMNPAFDFDKQWRWRKNVVAGDYTLSSVLEDDIDPRVMDLLQNRLFKYDPDERATAADASRHPYYDDLYALPRDSLPFQLHPTKPDRSPHITSH